MGDVPLSEVVVGGGPCEDVRQIHSHPDRRKNQHDADQDADCHSGTTHEPRTRKLLCHQRIVAPCASRVNGYLSATLLQQRSREIGILNGLPTGFRRPYRVVNRPGGQLEFVRYSDQQKACFRDADISP